MKKKLSFYERNQDKIELTKAYIGMVFLTFFFILDMYFNKQFYTEFMVASWSMALILITYGVFKK